MAKNFDVRGSYNKTTDSDVTYTGPSKGGVSTGDSLKNILSTILDMSDMLSRLSQKVRELELSNVNRNSAQLISGSSLYDLVDQSQSVDLGEKFITLNVSDTATSKANVFFDLTAAINSLDKKYVPVNIDTSIRTYDTKSKLLASSSSKTGNLSVDKTAGPLIVTSRVNLKSPEGGDLVLTKSFYLATTLPSKNVGKFQVSGISNVETDNFTQKQYNEILASNLSKLQKTIDSLDKKVLTIETKI